MSYRKDTVEMYRQKTAMSQKISKRDTSYGEYAGAYLEDAQTLALLKTLRDQNMFPQFTKQMNFLRDLLQEKRKAFFASTGSEITKLGFILGWTHIDVSAKDTREQLNQSRETSLSKTD